MTLKLSQIDTFDPSKRGFWAKTAADKKSGDIWLYDVIGSDWMGGISAKQFADSVKELGKVDEIRLFINCPGGSVFDSFAMLATLNRNPARISVFVDGVAASGGSLVAMAGDTISMASNSLLMIHNAWTVTAGNASELRDAADVLQNMDSQLADTYTARSGRKRTEIVAMLDAETWFSPDEAIAAGLADERSKELRVAACAWDFKAFGFKHPPETSAAAPETIVPPEVPLQDQITDNLNWLRSNPASRN